MSFKNRKLALIALISILFTQMSIPSFSAESKLSSKQTATVKSLFSDLASSQPTRINKAKKYVAKDSAAEKYVDLIEKHFLASEFFKVRDKYGNVSKLISDPKGTSKLSKNVVNFDSYFDVFDGKYSKFTFNKSGKITSWTHTSSDGKSAAIAGNIYSAVINYENDGLTVNTGYLWKRPNGSVFIQMKVTNVSAGLTSWSYAGGRYVAADNKFHSVETRPMGCLTEKGIVYLEALTSTEPVLAPNTDSVLVAPFYKSCDGENPKQLFLRFTLQ